MMYRFVFFKIPFMRGGYRVPACTPLAKPILFMSKFRVAEAVTDLAFAETQGNHCRRCDRHCSR